MEEAFKMGVLDGRHSVVMYVTWKQKGGHKRAERSLCVTEINLRDRQSVRKTKSIKLSGMTKRSAAISRVGHSFLSVIKVVLNYTRACKLHYTV